MEDSNKLHEETLKIAKSLIERDPALKDWVTEKFPELKESEDERIRNAVLKAIMTDEGREVMKDSGFKVEDILYWLEKQGEKHLFNFDEAEKEKNDFVSGQFIECRKSFNEFKEFESYWLEYVGDDTYIGRSDNILNQRFHITPQQLFTLFTHQHCPKEDEKQGEQMPADNVEPKFKIGDWIINNDKRIAVPTQILEIEEYGYVTSRGYTSFDKVKTDYHSWTIQDAKDGDVIANGDMVVIFKCFEEPSYRQHIIAHIWLDTCGRIQVTNEYWTLGLNCAKPATEEQRDLLFQKMKEAGYEWDAEKKEIRKTCQKPNYCHHEVDETGWTEEYRKAYYDGWNNCNQQHTQLEAQRKPTWSEEDEERFQSCVNILQEKGFMGVGVIETINSKWVKSIKDRISQPHWKPSKEQMKMLRAIVYEPYEVEAKFCNLSCREILKTLYDDLKNFES